MIVDHTQRFLKELLSTFGVVELLRSSVYAPVHCDSCRVYRARISPNEHAVLLVHHRLLCPCGGELTYIGALAKEGDA